MQEQKAEEAYFPIEMGFFTECQIRSFENNNELIKKPILPIQIVLL